MFPLSQSNTTPAFQLSVVEDVETEPVTLPEIKQFSKIDADYTSNDSDLEILRVSAREKLEGFLNVYLAQRKIKVQFYGGALKLPYSPTLRTDIISVTKNSETDPLDADKYQLTGLNEITLYIKDAIWEGSNTWFYPIYGGIPYLWTWQNGYPDFYTVEYITGYEIIPGLLKHALLALIDYMLKEQGSTEFEMPEAVFKLAKRFSRNLVIQ